MSAVAKYIANTWRGAPTEDDLAPESLMFACMHNEKEAERNEAKWRAAIPTLVDRERDAAIYAARVAYHDRAHWHGYVEYYRKLAARERPGR